MHTSSLPTHFPVFSQARFAALKCPLAGIDLTEVRGRCSVSTQEPMPPYAVGP